MTSMVLLLAVLFHTSVADVSPDTHPRVRPLDGGARAIVASAGQVSPTASALIATIERADVVVYVRTGVGLPTRGVLNFSACAGGLTYVLVRIDLHQGPQERVAVLAHELTHAVEITESPSPVCTQPALAALYGRIGTAGGHAGDVESARAVANERQALAEQRLALVLPCAITRKDPPMSCGPRVR
jgi:hypothetical protein